MPSTGRKEATPGPRNQWDSTLDHIEGAEPSQAGEVATGFEEGRGGGDKGINAQTGSGGYGGDAVEAGHDAALAEPDRPLDDEIHGDPRTPEGSVYPEEGGPNDARQNPIGESEVLDEEDTA